MAAAPRDGDATLSAVFHLIHCAVRTGHKFINRFRTPRLTDRHANGNPEGAVFVSRERAKFLAIPQELLGLGSGIFLSCLLKPKRKLITTQARNKIADPGPHRQHDRQISQNLVTSLMAVHIVYRLEIVEVDVHQRAGSAGPPMVGNAQSDLFEKSPPVEQAGQLISPQNPLQRFMIDDLLDGNTQTVRNADKETAVIIGPGGVILFPANGNSAVDNTVVARDSRQNDTGSGDTFDDPSWISVHN